MRKKRYVLVLSVCFLFIAFGILTVTSTLPKAIKDNSSYKINFSIYPFNFEFLNEKYKISAGRDTLNSALREMDNVKDVFDNVIERFTSPVK